MLSQETLELLFLNILMFSFIVGMVIALLGAVAFGIITLIKEVRKLKKEKEKAGEDIGDSRNF